MRGQPGGSPDDPVREQLLQDCEALQRCFPQLLPIYEGLGAFRHDSEIEVSRAGQQVCPDTCSSVHVVTADAENG